MTLITPCFSGLHPHISVFLIYSVYYADNYACPVIVTDVCFLSVFQGHPLALQYLYNNDRFASPPPAHMGIPPVHIDPKTGESTTTYLILLFVSIICCVWLSQSNLYKISVFVIDGITNNHN